VKENAVEQSDGGHRMLDRLVEQAGEQEIFWRENTPTEHRVEAAFLDYAGLSYRCVERGRCQS
jgi:hypothetical protein